MRSRTQIGEGRGEAKEDTDLRRRAQQLWDVGLSGFNIFSNLGRSSHLLKMKGRGQV